MAILGLAIEHAGSLDGAAIRDSVLEVSRPPAEAGAAAGQLDDALAAIRDGDAVDYRGASGPVDFDELLGAVQPYEVWRYDAPGTTPCPDSVPVAEGSFCRVDVIEADEIAE